MMEQFISDATYSPLNEEDKDWIDNENFVKIVTIA